MPHDPALTRRVRDLLAPIAGAEIDERAMFGGLAYLDRGHMFCGILGAELMVRVGPVRYAEALGLPHARPMDFTGRRLHAIAAGEDGGPAAAQGPAAQLTCPEGQEARGGRCAAEKMSRLSPGTGRSVGEGARALVEQPGQLGVAVGQAQAHAARGAHAGLALASEELGVSGGLEIGL